MVIFFAALPIKLIFFVDCSYWIPLPFKRSYPDKSVLCFRIFCSDAWACSNMARLFLLFVGESSWTCFTYCLIHLTFDCSCLLSVWHVTDHCGNYGGAPQFSSLHNTALCSSWWYICHDRCEILCEAHFVNTFSAKFSFTPSYQPIPIS